LFKVAKGGLSGRDNMLENNKYYNFQNKYKLSKMNFDVGHPRDMYQWPMTQFKLIKLKICQQAPIEVDVMINSFCIIFV
jgi:hypothetical protein